MLKFHDVEQNSLEWLELRRGIITASEMHKVLVKPRDKAARISQGAKTYRNKLIAERATGRFASNYYNNDMERGHEAEPFAVQRYEFVTGQQVKAGGFFTNFEELGTIGYSPDGVVGDDGLIEIKSRRDDLQIGFLLGEDDIPKDHFAQMQCGMWVTGRKWCDYICFNDFLPPFIRRVEADEDFFEEMRFRSELFNQEVQEGANKIMKMILEIDEMPNEPDIIDEYLKPETVSKDFRI